MSKLQRTFTYYFRTKFRKKVHNFESVPMKNDEKSEILRSILLHKDPSFFNSKFLHKLINLHIKNMEILLFLSRLIQIYIFIFNRVFTFSVT